MDFGITSIRNSLQKLDKAASTVKNTVNIGTNILDTVQNPVRALSNFGSKYSTENLAFPRDVENPDVGIGNHGHYILFSINTQERAKLRTSAIGSGGSRADDITRDANIPAFINNWDVVSGTYKKASAENEAAKRLHADLQQKENDFRQNFQNAIPSARTGVDARYQSKGSTIKIKRAPTKRLKTQIAMYMPQQVNVTYGANYTDTEIGDVTENALDAYNQFTQGKFTEAAESVFRIPKSAQDGVRNLLLGTVGALPGMGGTREAFEMKKGEIITDRLELAFKGINKRVFQYNFKMIPKNEEEAKEIRRIVFAFKANMLPEFEGGRAGRRLIVPNTFDIQYMYMGSQNQFLHHISTCVLENMNVAYGGDRYKTFNASDDGAPPVETNLTLNFKELELITRERVFEGY